MQSLKSWGTSAVQVHFWMAVLGAGLFTVESWARGPESWIYGLGSGLETIPVYRALSFGERNFSLWAPFVGGGLPRLAFWGNASPLSPEQLLFSTLPTWLANGLHRYLQYFIAIFFAARVAQEQLSLSTRWAAFAGWLHAAFAYLTAGALLLIPGVPLLLWLLDHLLRPGRSKRTALLAGLAFSFCTTFTFGVPYLMVLAVGWFLCVRPTRSLHALVQGVFFFLGLVTATSPQLFAVLSCAAESQRAHWPPPVVNWSLDGLFYRQLQFDMFAQDRILAAITLNLPGLAFLFGIPLVWFAARRRPELRPFCLQTAGVLAVYGLLSQRWLWLGSQRIASGVVPWIVGVDMCRFYMVPAAFLIVCFLTQLSYLVWQFLPEVRPVRAAAVGLGVGFVGFMAIWPKIQLFYPLGVDDWGEKNYQIAALEEIKAHEREPFRVASVLPLQPTYAYAQGVECADGWANLVPEVYHELWMRAQEPLLKRLPQVKNILDPDHGKPQDVYIYLGTDLIAPGIGALPGEDVRRSVREGFDLEPRFNLNILRALNVKYLLSEYPLQAEGLELVHAPEAPPTVPRLRCHATGVVYGKRFRETPRSPGLLGGAARLIAEFAEAEARKRRGKDIFIYELSGVLPRFRFVESVVVEPLPSAVLDRVASFTVERHLASAVIEAKDAAVLEDRRTFASGEVKLLDYRPDRIELEIGAGGSGLLVVANTWDPYWKARANGRPRQLVRLNHAQTGVLTEPGDSLLTLSYEPPYSPYSWMGNSPHTFSGAR